MKHQLDEDLDEEDHDKLVKIDLSIDKALYFQKFMVNYEDYDRSASDAWPLTLLM